MLSSGVYGACSHTENILQTLACKLEFDHKREWFQGSQFTEKTAVLWTGFATDSKLTYKHECHAIGPARETAPID